MFIDDAHAFPAVYVLEGEIVMQLKGNAVTLSEGLPPFWTFMSSEAQRQQHRSR
jgi:hypothetical protein